MPTVIWQGIYGEFDDIWCESGMKQHLTFIKKRISRPKKWDRVHRCQGPWHLSEKPLLGKPRVKCDHQFSGKTPSFLRTQSHTYVMSISLFWLLNIYIYPYIVPIYLGYFHVSLVFLGLATEWDAPRRSSATHYISKHYLGLGDVGNPMWDLDAIICMM